MRHTGDKDWARIQSRLQELGMRPGPIDGIRGRRTVAAVKRFQTHRGLAADGVAGPLTIAALFGEGDDQAHARDLPWMAEAGRLVGLTEVAGSGDNPVIMDMAADLDIDYSGDDVPWCGLFVAHCVGSALPDETLPANPLGARNWSRFGRPCDPSIGAVLVFWRLRRSGWRGHVGFCFGADRECYHVLGGNQSNAVNTRRIRKGRLLGARWPKSGAPWIADLAHGGLVGSVVAESDGDEK